MAFLLLVAIVAAAFAASSRPDDAAEGPLAVALAASSVPCGAQVTVAGAGDHDQWNDVALRVEYAPAYTIRVLDVMVIGGTWHGADLDEAHPIAPGDVIDVRLPAEATDAEIVVIDETSNTLVARIPLERGPPTRTSGSCE